MRDDAQARRCTTCGKRRFFHAQNRKNPALRWRKAGDEEEGGGVGAKETNERGEK